MRRLVLGVLVVGAALQVGAASAGGRAGSYPRSIVVIGHSGATGFASDPQHPFQDTPANSWATGTNPAVNSIYSRLVAANPAAEGHVRNFAVDGATVADLAAQVQKAIAVRPAPDLVLVQIGFNDPRCDGNDASYYAAFRATFAGELRKLAAGLPQAHLFVVGVTGSHSAASFVKTMEGLSTAARLTHASKSICSVFAPVSSPSPGQVVPAHLAYFQRTVAGYEAQLAAACAEFAQCRFDGGAAGRFPFTAGDLTSRYDHLSIAGNAKLAAAEWAAMRTAHVIPS
jgi:lysophospholipase L1-like esterase